MEDFQKAFTFILENSERFLGIESKKLRIYIVGSSLGGIVASTVSKDQFTYIDKIILAGSRSLAAI